MKTELKYRIEKRRNRKEKMKLKVEFTESKIRNKNEEILGK